MVRTIGKIMLVLTLVLAVACSQSAPSTETATGKVNEAGSGSTSGSSSNEQVTITWWDYMNSEAMVEALTHTIAEYESANPNVKIERTYIPFGDLKNKLLLGSAAGQLPDIIWIDNPDHQAFSAAGLLADITEEVNAWGEADQYFEGPWSSTMYEGKNYGIPNSSNNLALYYNVEMMEQAGIEPPTTWEELKIAAEKLTVGDVYGLGVSAVRNEQGTFQFLPFVWQADSDLDRFNSEGTIEAIELWKELVDEGYMSREILNQDQQAVMLQFVAGKVAMMVNGTWQIPALESDADFEWDIVTLPVYKRGGTILGGENWAITSTSDKKDVAWDIIAFMQRPEYLKPFLLAAGRLPSRKDLIEDPFWQDDPFLKIFADSMEVAKARAYGSEYPKISDAIQEMIHQVITGVKSAEDAVREADEIIQPLLN